MASILLQRKSDAKRVYAVVLNTITNTDGYKKEGITFPGQESMERLMRTAYEEINLDPKDTKYIEAHVTGTQAGDPVECRAIENVFCPDGRDGPVLLGCLKSNMGHPEGASGVAAITKACLIMQNKLIPPNINYENPNPHIPGLLNGKLKPVLEVTPFNEKVISLNSFGFGGTNIHTIIQSFEENRNDDVHNLSGIGGINRLILFKSRSEDAFKKLRHKIIWRPAEITTESLAFVDNLSSLDPCHDLPWRGYFILDQEKRILSCNWIKVDKTCADHGVIIVSEKSPTFGQNVINLLKDANIDVTVVDSITDHQVAKDGRKIIKIVSKDGINDDADDNNNTKGGEAKETETDPVIVTPFTTSDDILSLIGQLYMNGHDEIRLAKLYQPVQYPVSSSTVSVSPLFTWNHDADWTVYKVPDYFRLTQKNKRLYFDYSTTHHYLTGHVIDGRIIFPAAQYLWAIWQSLAMELTDNSQMAFLTTGIKFWNVSLTRAIIVDRGDEVTLVTRVNPFTGFFEIMQDDACLVTGHAQLTYDESVPKLEEGARNEGANQIGKRDFYKELRVRGYDYEDEFQGVDYCYSDGTGGSVSFLKNWVCFCDAVFQLTLINDTTRQLFLPTGFDFLQIDAKVFKPISKSEFELYEKFLQSSSVEDSAPDDEVGKSDDGQGGSKEPAAENSKVEKAEELPKFKVTIRKETREVFTDGLYVKGLKESPAPRKKAAPTVLKFQYHPFEESIFEDADTRSVKSDYADACLSVINNQDKLNEELFDLNNNFLEDAQDVEEKGDAPPEKPLLATLKKIKSEGKNISIEEIRKHSLQLSNDLLIQVPIENESFKHQLDIVTGAFHGQTLRVTEVNLSSKASVRVGVEETLKQSCPGTSYSLVSDTDDQKADDGQKIDRSIGDHLNLKSIESELIVVQHPSLGFSFMDTKENAQKRSEKFTNVLNSSFDQMINGNFLMVMARTESTLIEKELGADMDREVTLDRIRSEIKASGLTVISCKRVGPFVSILSRKCLNKNEPRPEMFETQTFNYDWVDKLRDQIFIEDGEGENVTRRPNGERADLDHFS